MSKIVLILLILCSFSLFSQEKEDAKCISSIDELFQSGQVDEGKMQELLKIQSEVTLHKMAYALLRNEISKERFTVEKKILSLLDTVKDKSEDPEFKKVYEMFNHPNNKLSRHALAEVLPFISNILNDQIDEEDPFKREMFNLNNSDIKMLSILTEKEKLYSSGAYAQILSSNRKSDNSILNFTKIINSSLVNTDDSIQNIKRRMENRLKKLTEISEKMIDDIYLGVTCEPKIQACVKDEDKKTEVIEEDKLLSLVTAVGKLDAFDKHKYLRYGDVWLHTKGIQKKKAKTSNNTGTQTGKKEVETNPKLINPEVEVSDDKIIEDYLVDHVLDHLPYFFTKEDLQNDKELTKSLAIAIDSGVLVKKGDERAFHYKGKSYIIPELWNGTYSSSMGRPGVSMKKMYNRWMMDEDENFKIPKANKIPKNLEKEFIETRTEQKEVFKHKYSFSFKGKLYDIKSGAELPRDKNSILKYTSSKKTSPIKDYSTEDKKIISKEIQDGNHSYIASDGVAKHISSAPINFDKEYSRAKVHFTKTNTNLNGSKTKLDFPSKSSFQNFVNSNSKDKALILKSLADKKRSYPKGDQFVDLIKLKTYGKDDAIKIIVDNKRKLGLNRTPSQFKNFDANYLAANASGFLNNSTTFKVGEKEYYTNNGFQKSQSRNSNTVYKGYTDHESLKKQENKINSGNSNLDILKKYHKERSNNSCSNYSVVDKKSKTITVYNNSGKILFSSEVLIGSESGDERTLYRDYENRVTNNKTGAGIYQIGSKIKANTDYHNQFNGKYLTLNSVTDTAPANIALAMSQVSESTPERSSLFNDNNLDNNRVSNGSIVLEKGKMAEYLNKYAKENCPYYILPESNQSKFQVVENQLVFRGSACSGKKSDCLKDYNYTSAVHAKPKKIMAYITDDRYKNKNTEAFVKSLVDEKTELMNLLNLTNNEYDELVKLSFGVMGVESDFGSTMLYKFKETGLGQAVIDYSKGNVLPNIGISPTIPIPISTFIDNPNNSRGPTQVKHLSQYLKGKFKNIETADLKDPKNAAIATMFVLADKLKTLKRIEYNHSHINESNRIDYLYYLYMGSSDQITKGGATPKLNPKVSEAIEYSKKLTVLVKN